MAAIPLPMLALAAVAAVAAMTAVTAAQQRQPVPAPKLPDIGRAIDRMTTELRDRVAGAIESCRQAAAAVGGAIALMTSTTGDEAKTDEAETETATDADDAAKNERETKRQVRERQRAESREKKHGDRNWEEPASEQYVRDMAKRLEKVKSKKDRRKAHDEKVGPDRTKKEIDKDYSVDKGKR